MNYIFHKNKNCQFHGDFKYTNTITYIYIYNMHAIHTSPFNISPTDIKRHRDRDQDECSLLELGHQDNTMWEMRVISASEQHFFSTVFKLDLNI